MGTVVEITWIGTSHDNSAVKRAYEAMKTISLRMNPDDPTCDLGRVNSRAGKGFVHVSSQTCRVVREGLRIGKQTKGAFDITLYPLIHLWGFDTKSPHLPSPAAIRNALAHTGLQKVLCDPATHQIKLTEAGMGLDLGGIAKGFAVDKASALLRARGLRTFLVNAGGDLYCAGHPPSRPWRIGIQDPDDPQAVLAILSLTDDRAIATSGDYENYFIRDHIRYHHILDPMTGFPTRGLRSVSVLASTTMEADALATALFVMGKKQAIRWLKAHPAYAGVLVDSLCHIAASHSLNHLIKWKKRVKRNVSYF